MIGPGPHTIDREQPPLSRADKETTDRFHQLYYQRWIDGGDTINLTWFGHAILKCPFDLWMYQELLVRTRPDIVVEAGTYLGGSALYFATLFDLLGHGRVLTIDIEARKPVWPVHPRIDYLTGSSTDDAIVQRVRNEIGSRRVMIVLDSDHSADHVYAELMAYHPLVQSGDYLIVEDTNVNGHPAWPSYGPGPMEAVDRFLADHDQFQIDPTCERFLLTLHPRGYLRRL